MGSTRPRAREAGQKKIQCENTIGETKKHRTIHSRRVHRQGTLEQIPIDFVSLWISGYYMAWFTFRPELCIHICSENGNEHRFSSVSVGSHVFHATTKANVAAERLKYITQTAQMRNKFIVGIFIFYTHHSKQWQKKHKLKHGPLVAFEFIKWNEMENGEAKDKFILILFTKFHVCRPHVPRSLCERET